MVNVFLETGFTGFNLKVNVQNLSREALEIDTTNKATTYIQSPSLANITPANAYTKSITFMLNIYAYPP
jgi:hypothetical protein